MTPIEVTAQDITTTDEYLDGFGDAAMGTSPQSKDEKYITGYLASIRATLLDDTYTLQIRWLSQSFTRGAYD
jgi:hypothetical protein